jgi:hypothetical protein
MLASDVLATPRSLLDDPNKVGWSDADLISYLNSFMLDAVGRRRDLYALVVSQNLVAGSYQQVPNDGFQFLEPYFAGNGQAVISINIEDRKHSQFKATMVAAANANPQVVAKDPRDRKGFWVFPASTGTSSTLQYLYAATPALLVNLTDTYPLDPDTFAAAQWYVLGSAYDKNTERRDTVKSEAYMARYLNWIAGSAQDQAAVETQQP